MSMSRLSWVHVEIFKRSTDFRTLIRLFVRSCQNNRALTRLLCVHQTFCAFMSRLSSVHQTIRAFMSRHSSVHQTIRAFMSRHSCVHQTFASAQIFVRLRTDFRAFTRPFVRSCPDFCIFTRLPCLHIFSCLDALTLVRSSDHMCNQLQCSDIEV